MSRVPHTALASCLLLAAMLLSFDVADADAGKILDWAIELYEDGSYIQAYNKALRAISKDPLNPRAHYIAGAAGLEIHGSRDDIDLNDVRNHLVRAYKLDPEIPGLNFMIGSVVMKLANRERSEATRVQYRLTAAHHFELELELDPAHTKALRERAKAYELAGEPGRAVAAYEDLVATGPGSSKPYEYLAEHYVAEEEDDKAFALLSTLSPDSRRISEAVALLMAEGFAKRTPPAVERIVRLREGDRPAWSAGLLRMIELSLENRFEEAIAIALALEIPPEHLKATWPAFHAISTANEGHLGNGYRQPERIGAPELKYPELARKARIEAKVLVGCVIDIDGKAHVLAITTRRPGLGFEEEVEQVVRAATFRPASLDWEPISAIFTMRFDFTLHR